MSGPPSPDQDAGGLVYDGEKYPNSTIESIATQDNVNHNKSARDLMCALHNRAGHRCDDESDSNLVVAQYVSTSSFPIMNLLSASSCASGELPEAAFEQENFENNIKGRESDGEDKCPMGTRVEFPEALDPPSVRYLSIIPEFLNPQLSDSATAARKRRGSASADSSISGNTACDPDAGAGQNHDNASVGIMPKDITLVPHVLSLVELVEQLRAEVGKQEQALFADDSFEHNDRNQEDFELNGYIRFPVFTNDLLIDGEWTGKGLATDQLNGINDI